MVFTLVALKNFANFTGKIHVLESRFKKAPTQVFNTGIFL